jgi:hypothetical protein
MCETSENCQPWAVLDVLSKRAYCRAVGFLVQTNYPAGAGDHRGVSKIRHRHRRIRSRGIRATESLGSPAGSRHRVQLHGNGKFFRRREKHYRHLVGERRDTSSTSLARAEMDRLRGLRKRTDSKLRALLRAYDAVPPHEARRPRSPATTSEPDRTYGGVLEGRTRVPVWLPMRGLPTRSDAA